MLRLFVVFALIAFGTTLPGTAAAKRVALVIGNSAYKHTQPLDNPRNDAADMAAVLKKLGFEVIEGFDLQKAGLEHKVRDFAAALSDADVGLFYYAGHGLQAAGQNYLVPVDAELATASALDFETVRLDLVHRTMERETKTNILFLDACRNNPLARNLARAMGTRSVEIGRGLAAVESGAGTLISFSTQPGNVALDGSGRNSPFAGALVRHLMTSSDDLSAILINVRNDVMKETRDKQVPWEHSALRGRVWFKGAPSPGSAALPLASAVAPPLSEAALAWQTIESTQDASVFEAFRRQFGADNPVYDQLAASKIAALKRAQEQKVAAFQPAPTPAPKAPPDDPKALAELLQRELVRVGCYAGRVDGEWGPGSRSALASFNLYAKMALPTDRAEARSVQAVQTALTRICPEDRPSPSGTAAASLPTFPAAPPSSNDAEALRALSELVNLGVTMRDAVRAKERAAAGRTSAPVQTDASTAPGRPPGYKDPTATPKQPPPPQQAAAGAKQPPGQQRASQASCQQMAQRYEAYARTAGAPGTMQPLFSMYQYLQCNCGYPPSPQLPPCPR